MAMDEASYVPAQGVAMLSQFSTNQIKGALDELGAKHIAAQLDKEHRLPGRNFAFDNRCISFASPVRFASATLTQSIDQVLRPPQLPPRPGAPSDGFAL
jgi:hypothetical protein